MKTILLFVIAGAVIAPIGNIGAQEANIYVNPGQVLHPISPYLTGACLEDVNHEVYGGFYSQMIFGESFQEPAPARTAGGLHGIWGHLAGHQQRFAFSQWKRSQVDRQ